MWAITMVVKPRCGQPNTFNMDTNSSSWVMPVIDFRHDQRSVDHSGEQEPAAEHVEPHEGDGRESAEHDRSGREPPRRCAGGDSHAASRIWSLCTSSVYQLVENPPHTLTSAEALKE